MADLEIRCDLAQHGTQLAHCWEHTVGSCHAPLALRADWQGQLKRCHAELGFPYVRFHGVLSDDVGTLVRQQNRLIFSFFNSDRIIDFLLSIGMRPFVELSFMPTALASGFKTVFRYRGNVTPPRDYRHWATLVGRLVRHWVDRYGMREVRHWFFEVWKAWTKSYDWRCLYGHEFLFGGPLFMHQLSHIWIDFRGIQDDFMRRHRVDYFENSRRATYVQQQYAIRNPRRFTGYGEHAWGITASNGPGPAVRRIGGVRRRFFGYRARGVPYGPDDGTLSAWAVAASLPFAPEIVLPTLRHYLDTYPGITNEYGLVCSSNPTFPSSARRRSGWLSKAHFALDQGPVILMIENYRSGLIWRLMRSSVPIVRGLRRAGFSGGWLT